MPQIAYVVYDVKVVFTVDLEHEVVELAEIDAETLEHFDTSLAEPPPGSRDWLRLHARARELVEAAPRVAKLKWEQ